MSPLRILHVLTHNQVTRGGAIQALLLARGQRKQGHRVEVIVNSKPERKLHDTFDPWLAEGIPIHAFHQSSKKELLRFRRFYGAFRPDVLHAHRDTALQFAFFSTTFATPPAFISQRGTTHPFRTRTTAFCHRSRRVHRIIAVAEAVKEALVCFGVSADRIDVVYGSFDPERFDPDCADRNKLRDELGLKEGEKLIAQVGELHRKKAPWDFISAAALLLKERDDLHFALIGKGKQREVCEEQIRDLGIGDRMHMVGFRSDIADVYAATDIAVNCSTGFEGLTGAMREALAMARPIAATRVDGNPEAVRDGETGILVPPRDPEAMAYAIGELLDNPQQARAFGDAGRRLVLELMHPEVRIRRVEEVYRQVLGERNRLATASA